MYKYLGRMNDPDGSAFVKGICGDEMEFYLIVQNNVITDVKFYTEGCDHTKICGEMTAELVLGNKIEDALKISPATVIKKIDNLPPDHLHCTILTTITFLKALADYLLKI